MAFVAVLLPPLVRTSRTSSHLFVNSNLPSRLPPKVRVLSSPNRLVRQQCRRGGVFAQPTVSFAHKIFLSLQ